MKNITVLFICGALILVTAAFYSLAKRSVEVLSPLVNSDLKSASSSIPLTTSSSRLSGNATLKASPSPVEALASAQQRFVQLQGKALLRTEEKTELAALASDPELARRHFDALKNNAPELQRLQAVDWLESALKYQEPARAAETVQEVLAILADRSLREKPDSKEFRSLAGDRIEMALVVIAHAPSSRNDVIQALRESGMQGLTQIVAARSLELLKED